MKRLGLSRARKRRRRLPIDDWFDGLMKEQTMTTEELRAKLAEHDALPDDMMARIDWETANPAPTLTIRCRQCGSVSVRQTGWGEVKRELELRGGVPAEIEAATCERCNDGDD